MNTLKRTFGTVSMVALSALWLVPGCVGQEPGDENDPDALVLSEAKEDQVSKGEDVTEDVVVELSSDSNVIKASDDLKVVVTMTNPTDHPIRLLTFNTVADGIRENLFDITRDGVQVRYEGRIYERLASQGEYITVEAGQHVTYTVSLADAYDFSISGHYAIRYASAVPHGSVTFSSNVLALSIEGRPTFEASEDQTSKGQASKGLKDDNSFVAITGCGSSRAQLIQSAFTYAKAYTKEAKDYVINNPTKTDRWTKWFGEFNTSRWNTVKTGYTKILTTLNQQEVQVLCDCNEPWNGYVVPSQPYKIHVCQGFWNEPTFGHQSKAGTLIHETSHFLAVIGTVDSQAEPIKSAYRFTWFAVDK